MYKSSVVASRPAGGREARVEFTFPMVVQSTITCISANYAFRLPLNAPPKAASELLEGQCACRANARCMTTRLGLFMGGALWFTFSLHNKTDTSSHLCESPVLSNGQEKLTYL